MARFTQPAGSGGGTELPQGLATNSSPTFVKVITTSNGATDNLKIGDDAYIGDGNVANHVVIIGQQDATAGGIVLGSAETEVISTNGTDLSLTADNDIVLYPGSNYAYLNAIDEDHRLATMADILSGGGSDAESTVYLVRNNTGSTISKGTLVSAVGAEPSGRIDIAPHETTGLQNSELRVMGMATSNISSGVNGTVMSFGTLTGIDTRGTSASAIAVGDETWAEGDILYAHPTADGKLTNVRPQHDLAVAFITVRHASSGQIAIRIVPGNNHLEWLHDVVLDSPADNEVLAFDSASGLWKNQTAAEAGLQTRVTNVSDTEIGYLANVTSDIQTQLNQKPDLLSPTITTASFASSSETTDPVTISTANNHGGVGFAGLMKLENAGAGVTNSKKFIRMNSTGGLEVVNNNYSSTIFHLADNGDLSAINTVNGATIGDSGWQTVSSFTNGYSGNSVAYRKINNVVYLRGNISGGTSGSVAFTLPSGYRPSTIEHVVLVQKYGTMTASYITIQTDGQVIPQEDAAWLSGIVYPVN